MKTHYLILLFFFIAFKTYSQEFYTTDRTDIIKVTLTDPNNYKTQILKHMGQPDFISIALYKNTLYFNDFFALYKGTIKKDSLVNIQKLSDVDYYPTSLTVDSSAMLFFAIGRDLYKYHEGGSIEKLGTMPYESAGDLVFYKGSLYMASLEGIVKVDVLNPAASTLFIPTASSNILGLTSVAFDCKTNKIYAFEASSDATQMLEIDFDQKTVTTAPYFLNFHVSDAGSSVETGIVPGITVDSIGIIPQCGTNTANITIHGSPNFQQFTYSLNNENNTTGVFNDLIPGKYNFSVTTASGCVKDTFVVVPDFNVKPIITINKADPVCGDDGKIGLSLNSKQFRIKYKSDTLTNNYNLEKLAVGKYTFGIINAYGCQVDSVTIQLYQNGPCGLINFPTAFTPNNDGINDIFRADQRTIVKQFTLNVFNRWGKLLFTSNDIHQGWNGEFKGKYVPEGTYYWEINYLSYDGKTMHQGGAVALIR